MSSARLAGSKGKEGKGGVRGIRKVASGSGDDEEIKQREGSMDHEGPDKGESEHEQRRGLKTATYGSGGKSVTGHRSRFRLRGKGPGQSRCRLGATVSGNGGLFVSRGTAKSISDQSELVRLRGQRHTLLVLGESGSKIGLNLNRTGPNTRFRFKIQALPVPKPNARSSVRAARKNRDFVPTRGFGPKNPIISKQVVYARCAFEPQLFGARLWLGAARLLRTRSVVVGADARVADEALCGLDLLVIEHVRLDYEAHLLRLASAACLSDNLSEGSQAAHQIYQRLTGEMHVAEHRAARSPRSRRPYRPRSIRPALLSPARGDKSERDAPRRWACSTHRAEDTDADDERMHPSHALFRAHSERRDALDSLDCLAPCGHKKVMTTSTIPDNLGRMLI
ncbi:hypothetical protein FB451DRAFT_1508466 [Mycena latifolia]|nr:hypothetical protein FB451DRAFT_1508466 [Mycena latifolia]